MNILNHLRRAFSGRRPAHCSLPELTSTTGTPEDLLRTTARKIADTSMQWGHHYTAFERARDIEPFLREWQAENATGEAALPARKDT